MNGFFRFSVCGFFSFSWWVKWLNLLFIDSVVEVWIYVVCVCLCIVCSGVVRFSGVVWMVKLCGNSLY